MKKLKPKDIVIKKRGAQVRELIYDKYYTIENFSKYVDFEASSISQYLKGSELGSERFRLDLVEHFDMGIDELALNKRQQIKRFVHTILHNYPHYTDEKDLITYAKIMKLCKEENMEAEMITMERNKAMYYFKDNRPKQAIDMLKEIAEKAHRRKLYYHWVYFNCDMAVIYGHNANYEKAKNIYKCLPINNLEKARDEDFKNKAFFKYHFHRGVIFNRIGEHVKAEEMFEESLNYAIEDRFKGTSILGIGLSYKLREEYDKALEYYNKALKLQPLPEKKILILNNISEVYKQKGDYEKAIDYIDRAIGAIDFYEVKNQFIAYVTYLEIKFLMGKKDEILDKLIDLTVKGNDNWIRKSDIHVALSSVIKLAKDIKSHDYLFKVEELIMNMIDASNEKAFIRGLETCLGKISRFFLEEKYIRRPL